MNIRIKRKPPTYEMKFVRGLSRSGCVQIEKVSVPLVPNLGVNQRTHEEGPMNARGSGHSISEHSHINDMPNDVPGILRNIVTVCVCLCACVRACVCHRHSRVCVP